MKDKMREAMKEAFRLGKEHEHCEEGTIGRRMAQEEFDELLEESLSAPPPAADPVPEKPEGAIHNGRVFMDRMADRYRLFRADTGQELLERCEEWEGIRQCFEAMADYIAAAGKFRPTEDERKRIAKRIWEECSLPLSQGEAEMLADEVIAVMDERKRTDPADDDVEAIMREAWEEQESYEKITSGFSFDYAKRAEVSGVYGSTQWQIFERRKFLAKIIIAVINSRRADIEPCTEEPKA